MGYDLPNDEEPQLSREVERRKLLCREIKKVNEGLTLVPVSMIGIGVTQRNDTIMLVVAIARIFTATSIYRYAKIVF